jgi:hypothetical protein
MESVGFEVVLDISNREADYRHASRPALVRLPSFSLWLSLSAVSIGMYSSSNTLLDSW